MIESPIVAGTVAIDYQNSRARALLPKDRKDIALKVLEGEKVAEVARQQQVSRKFVYRQTNQAREAINTAFDDPAQGEEQVLFHIAVTKSLVKQIVLVLLLRCHSSYRGVIAFFSDLFGYHISLGTVHNIVAAVIAKADEVNTSVNINPIKTACHDEIYQASHPILVGVDARSNYCHLLAVADHADGETWGCELLDLMGRGFSPERIIADLGNGLRRGHRLAMPNVPCFADIFHALRDMATVMRHCNSKLSSATKHRKKLDDKVTLLQLRGKKISCYNRTLARAYEKEKSLQSLVENLAILFDWLENDVLKLAGVSYDERLELFDFIICSLKNLDSGHKKLKTLRKGLERHKFDLLGFANQIDQNLESLAKKFGVEKQVLEKLCVILGTSEADNKRYQMENDLRRMLGKQFHLIHREVEQMLAATVRASSLVESTNSILRSYFFLRQQVGSNYLKLLQFYLNHRVLKHSERPERIGKSPRELMTGETHPHWLELLGFQRSQRCA